jgi:hypothetical protein
MSLSWTEVAMQHTIPELDRSGLRHFGLMTGAIVVAIFGFLFPWLLDRSWPVWPWIIASPLWALALVYPAWLKPIYRGWMRFGLLASRVTTPIILGIVFYLVITPISFLLRLGARDPMRRTFESDTSSYRVSSHKLATDRLEKPF